MPVFRFCLRLGIDSGDRLDSKTNNSHYVFNWALLTGPLFQHFLTTHDNLCLRQCQNKQKIFFSSEESCAAEGFRRRIGWVNSWGIGFWGLNKYLNRS